MWEAPASLKRSIEVILCIELKQSYCEILESVPAVFAKLSWNFHPSLSNCSALAGNRQHMTGRDMTCDNIWPVEIWPGRDMTCFDGFVLEKIAFCLKRSGTKYRYFIWAKRSTAWRAAMVHSALRIALLSVSFDVAFAESTEQSRFHPPRVEFSSVDLKKLKSNIMMCFRF